MFVCVCSVYVVVIQHSDQKQLGEESVYLAYRLQSLREGRIKEGTQGRNLEAGIKAAAMEEH